MPAAVPAAITAGGGLLGGLIGGGGPSNAQPVLPRDLQGQRASNIALLNYLLGFGNAPGGNGGPTQFGGSRGNVQTRNQFQPFRPPSGPPAGSGFDPTALGAAGGSALQRLQSYFGQLGTPTSALQNQTASALQKLLAGPSAYDQASPALQAILNGKPGQGVMDALQPQFERNLALANQQGGRFGTANAVLKSRALEDYNLLGAQAAQQGQQTQLQAGNLLGLLQGQGIANQQTGYGVGQQQALQNASGQQQALQILMQLLGVSQGATLGTQNAVQPTGAQQGFDIGGQLAQLIALYGRNGGGGIPAGATQYSGGGSLGTGFA